MIKGIIISFFLLFSLSAKGQKIVTYATGFEISHAWMVEADPSTVYGALTDDVGQWWNGDHTYSLDAKNMYFVLKQPGCLCEQLPNSGWVEHLRLVYLAPGKEIRLVGGLGPLQSMAVNGIMILTLGQEGAYTKLQLVYKVGGNEAIRDWAQPVAGVLVEQFDRLVEHMKKGKN